MRKALLPLSLAIIFAIAGAGSASATRNHRVGAVRNCPVAACVVDTSGQEFTYSYLRPDPCNDKPPLKTLNSGNVVYSLKNEKKGCNYDYTQVLYVDPDTSEYLVGWISSSYIPTCSKLGSSGRVPIAAITPGDDDDQPEGSEGSSDLAPP